MKISKCIVFLAGLIWLAGVVPAEGQSEGRFRSRFLMGFTGGATVSSGNYQFVNGPEPPRFNPLIFPGGGLTFDWRMTKWLSLQNAFLYKAKGDNIDMKLWSEEFYKKLAPFSNPSFSFVGNGFVKTDIRYFEWSLCPNIILGRIVEIGIGGFAAIGLSGKETQDYVVNYLWDGKNFQSDEVNTSRPVEFVFYAPSSDNKDILYINRLDYGLCGRLGFRLGPVTLAGCFSYSLNTWEPDPLLGLQSAQNQTQNLSGMASLTFFLGKRN